MVNLQIIDNAKYYSQVLLVKLSAIQQLRMCWSVGKLRKRTLM